MVLNMTTPLDNVLSKLELLQGYFEPNNSSNKLKQDVNDLSGYSFAQKYLQEHCSLNKVKPDDIDLYTQTSFKELALINQSDKLGYLIAATSDECGNTLVLDANSFVEAYYLHEQNKSPTTRKEINDAKFYLYPNKKKTNQKGADNLTNSLGSCIPQFSLEALKSPWILRYIHAHKQLVNTDMTLEDKLNILEDRYALGELYEFGPLHAEFKIVKRIDDKTVEIVDDIAYKFFQKNSKLAKYWYKRAAKWGHVKAYESLTRLYLNSSIEEHEFNKGKGLKCLERAQQISPEPVEKFKYKRLVDALNKVGT